MMVLDTNVVSEVMRRDPDQRVLAWMDSQRWDDLYLTSMTAAELLHGAARLPAGRRREALGRKIAVLLEDLFAGRVLPFDLAAAVEYAGIVSARERAGLPTGVADAVIAATVRAAGADALATRNRRDFVGSAIALVDPWAA